MAFNQKSAVVTEMAVRLFFLLIWFHIRIYLYFNPGRVDTAVCLTYDYCVCDVTFALCRVVTVMSTVYKKFFYKK